MHYVPFHLICKRTFYKINEFPESIQVNYLLNLIVRASVNSIPTKLSKKDYYRQIKEEDKNNKNLNEKD